MAESQEIRHLSELHKAVVNTAYWNPSLRPLMKEVSDLIWVKLEVLLVSPQEAQESPRAKKGPNSP